MEIAPELREQLDAQGILHVIFDRPGDSPNIFTADLLAAMGRWVDSIPRRGEVKAILFESAKPGNFIAGMDVDTIAAIDDAYRGAEGARQGQALFERIHQLSVPTACAINGACMGGGTEMALACDFRIASDHPKMRIALPEVQIGVIPGFGGTQRLPSLVGLQPALRMILTGQRLDGRRARKIGLVDAVVPAPYLVRESCKLLERAVEEGVDQVAGTLRRRRSLLHRAIETVPFLRQRAFAKAREMTEKRAAEVNYPAPFRALEAIEASYKHSLPQGLDFEARLIGELIPTPTTKNLIWLFKAHTASKRALAGPASASPVRRTAVLGAGIMGGGISQLIADRGLPVRLKDIQWDAVSTAYQTAAAIWRRQARRKRWSPWKMRSKFGEISPTVEYSGFRHVDMVVEAVVENLEIKRTVLSDVEARIGSQAVFASNTSSLPIGEIAAHARYPERVVGLHFFNPVHRMPLVEVIAGPRSSPEAIATTHAFALRLGKVPVVVKDGPGFLVNRLLMFYMIEAIRLLEEGVRIDALDRAVKAFGMPMGPFELLDVVGLDTARHVAGVLQSAFTERIGNDRTLLDTMVEQGRLGQKSGRGFWRWKDGKKLSAETEVYRFAGDPTPRDVPPETLEERVILTMVNEAARCLDEGVVATPTDIDLAMVMGTGFPPFRGGLLRYADAVGIPVVADRLARLANAHGERLAPADRLQRMVREQRRFYG